MSRSKHRPPPGDMELQLDGFTHGAEAVGRRDDGKVCFVPHALPGERVRVAVETERKRWSRGRLLEVLEPSEDRVEPPCPYAQPDLCGGCALQHARPARQAELLRQVLVDQLERIGHLPEPPVMETVRPHDGDGLGYRVRARFAADREGRLGFHRHQSEEIVPIDRCLLLTAQAQQTRTQAGDHWPGINGVVVRSNDRGPGLIEVDPGEGLLPDLPDGQQSLTLIDALGRAHAMRGEPYVHYEVQGAAFRVSATSFFQPSLTGAGVLVDEVLKGAQVQPGDHVLDLYSGVGLFSRFLSTAGADVTAIEGHPVAVADAQHNLSEVDVDVVHSDAAKGVRDLLASERRVHTVVLDPPRQGAGQALCNDVVRLGAERIVYVACDPAALARDARELVDHGYQLQRVVPVDQFTHTGHIEAVATFGRS